MGPAGGAAKGTNLLTKTGQGAGGVLKAGRGMLDDVGGFLGRTFGKRGTGVRPGKDVARIHPEADKIAQGINITGPGAAKTTGSTIARVTESTGEQIGQGLSKMIPNIWNKIASGGKSLINKGKTGIKKLVDDQKEMQEIGKRLRTPSTTGKSLLGRGKGLRERGGEMLERGRGMWRNVERGGKGLLSRGLKRGGEMLGRGKGGWFDDVVKQFDAGAQRSRGINPNRPWGGRRGTRADFYKGLNQGGLKDRLGAYGAGIQNVAKGTLTRLGRGGRNMLGRGKEMLKGLSKRDKKMPRSWRRNRRRNSSTYWRWSRIIQKEKTSQRQSWRASSHR